MQTINHIVLQASSALNTATDTPRLDAEVLIVHALGKNRSFLRTWPDKPLSEFELARIKQLVDLRLVGTPIAYLTGEKEFWSRPFRVSPKVLIPRPETELLVDQTLALLAAQSSRKILDLGTGSGVIAITLAAENRSTSIVASDLSLEAINVAKDNAKRLDIDRIKFIRSDWFSELGGEYFDLITSNPPYIAENDPHLKRGDLQFEPQFALVAGAEGFDALELIADRAREHLHPGGYLLLEHGYQQAKKLHRMLTQMNFSNVNAFPDLQGHLRVTQAQWGAPN